MLRYLKRAFFATARLPLVGRAPFNVLFVALIFAAGFNREWRSIWLFGAWIELAYLWVLATNKRFQNAVDAEALAQEQTDPQAQRRRLVKQLAPEAMRRLDQLQSQCNQAIDTARRSGTEDYALQSQRDGLDRLSWFYLKLLLARQMLTTQEPNAAAAEMRRQMSQLEKDVASTTGSPSVRESKAETLRILRRRFELLQRRGEALEQIDADLARIEAEAALAVDNASLGPQSEHFGGTITLATAMLETDLFGASQLTVDALDQRYQATLEKN